MAWKQAPQRSADSSYGAVANATPDDEALVFHGSPYPAQAWDQQPYQDPGSTRGRALYDQAVWQSPVYPVAEISANQVIDIGDYAHGAPESITRWTPWEHEGITPLPNGAENQPSGHRLLGNANFFASDPSRGPGSPSQGCYMSTDWTWMVLNQPGTVMQGHQTFWGPYQPKPSVDFFPSTVYQPSPSFGVVAPKVGQ
jgi:hypothetical protein